MHNTSTRLFILSVLLTCFIVHTWGTTYIANNGTEDVEWTTITSTNVSSGSVDVISWTGSNCTYSSNRVNISAGGSITFSAEEGYLITKIVITSGSSSTYYGTWTSSPAGGTPASANITTLQGFSSQTVTISTSTAFRCTSASNIKIFYTDANACTDPATVLSISSAASATVGTPLSLTTTGGNGSAVTWSIVSGSSYASLSGSTLTPTAAGTVRVQARQNESSGTCGATITQDITISLAPINVTLHYKGTSTALNNQPNPYTLPTTGDYCGNACDDWVFDGWYGSSYAKSTSKPSYITQLTSAGSAYAIYKNIEDGGVSGTWVASEQGWTNGDNATTKTAGDITVSWSQNEGAYAPKYYTTGSAVRAYGKNQFTVSSTGGNMSSIVLGFGSGDGSIAISVSPGSYSGGTWTGNASSVTFTVGNASGNRRIASITASGGTINYSSEAECKNCTEPTLSFGATSSVNKFMGDTKFTYTATPGNNPMGGTVSYSSDKPTKASIDPTTGEVTILDATGSEPVTITATLGAVDDGVNCQKQVTASYTLYIYNKVTWLVNDEEYTAGTPTTQVSEGGTITQLPTTPNGDTYCGGKTFIGWTDHEVSDPAATAPSPLYKTASDFSGINISENKTYYAVFATVTPGTGTSATYEFSITSSDFSGTSYDANNGSHTSTATDTSNPSNTMTVTWVSNNVSNSSGTQWRKSIGYIYNSTDLGKINSVTISGDALSVYYGTSEEPTGTSLGSNDGYFKVANTTNNALHTTSVTVNFTKSTGTPDTYSDYSTVCGTCLPAPTDPIVTPKSNRATIDWTAVQDATGYTVTCSGGSVSVSGTTANITGLSPNTTYTYSIRSQGDDPYSCFPAYNGSFTTTDCEDAPVLGAVETTTTTAAISWTCEAATATVRVYEDAECDTQVGSDYTLCTSPYTVSHLTSGTTYYYKVLAGGTCTSAVGSFTTDELVLDIAEWQPDAVVISYNGDADLTLTTYTEETHGDPHANVADDIFFSKYFEAAANVKLLAIFNGTLNTVDLSDYQLGLAQAGAGTSATQAFAFKKFSEFVKTSGGGLTTDELLLESNEELILITYTTAENDEAIIKCAKDDEEHSKFSTYVRISTPELQFNGDDVVSLLNPDGDMIDLIGAGTKNGGLDRGGDSFIYRSSGVDYNGFMDTPGGWYTTSGYRANTDNSETAGYALSTNRCLLIRRKHVKSGHIAVELNGSDFVTLGAHTYMGNAREGEWKGVQIPGSTTQGTKPGLSNSCDGFEVVGSYNYNEYYVDFEINGTPTVFDDFRSDPFDGTYVIPVANLDEKACTQVRIELKDGDDNLIIRKDVKVPIMIETDQSTTDEVFHSHYKDADICRECDVVILNGATLTKAADGTAGDIDQVRNLKVYENGKLVVPAGRSYTINSLALRRSEDIVPLADIQGTLDVTKTNGVSLDLRIDPSNWHYVCLPYDCNVDDIVFSDGTAAVPGVDFALRWYDGAYRAAHLSGGWKPIASGSVIKKGMGFVVGLAGSDIIKKELRFPMANEVLADEANNKAITPVYGHGNDKTDEELTPNHKGWNLIGNPYMMYYHSDITEPLAVGQLVEDETTHRYERTGSLRYLVIPNGWNGRDGYSQVDISTHMKPFTAYFVQVGGNPTDEQTIDFHVAQAGQNSIVRPRKATAEEEEDRHPVWFGLTLTAPNGETDHTALLISDDFTDGYDMMDDLVKLRGTYYNRPSVSTAPVLASRNDRGEMAFNALPDRSAAVTGVPLNYYASSDGDYTFAIYDRYSTEEIKSALLYDNTTGLYYDLLTDGYAFSTAKGDDTNRFRLFVEVERKKAPEVATGLENRSGSDRPRKVLIGGHVYIVRGGAVYDITGKPLLNQ